MARASRSRTPRSGARSAIAAVVAASALGVALWPVASPGACRRLNERMDGYAADVSGQPLDGAPDMVLAMSPHALGDIVSAHLRPLEQSLNERLSNFAISGLDRSASIDARFSTGAVQSRLTLRAAGVPVVGDLALAFDVSARVQAGLALDPTPTGTLLRAVAGTDIVSDIRVVPADAGPFVRTLAATASRWVEQAVRTLLPTAVADLPLWTLTPAQLADGQPALVAAGLRVMPDRSALLIGLDATTGSPTPPPWPTDTGSESLSLFVAPDLLGDMANQAPADSTAPRRVWIHSIDTTTDTPQFDISVARARFPCMEFRGRIAGRLVQHDGHLTIDITEQPRWQVVQGGPLARLLAPSEDRLERELSERLAPALELWAVPLPTGVTVGIHTTGIAATDGWFRIDAQLDGELADRGVGGD